MPLSVTAILYLYWDCSLLLVVLLVRHEIHVGQKLKHQTVVSNPLLSNIVWFCWFISQIWHAKAAKVDLLPLTDTTITKPPICKALADKRPSLKSNNTSEYWISITKTAYMSAGADYADSSDWKYWMVQRQDPGREGKYRWTNTGVTNMQQTATTQYYTCQEVL